MNKKLNNLDLTDIESSFNSQQFDSLVRIDDLFFGSKVISTEQVEFLKKMSVNVVIDLKSDSETEFDDREEFKKAGIEYINFPVSNIDNISFEMLCSLKKKLEKFNGKKLIYCMSGNRVGALFTLLLSEVLGHPKERALEYGKKVGMTKELLIEKVKNKIHLKEKVA